MITQNFISFLWKQVLALQEFARLSVATRLRIFLRVSGFLLLAVMVLGLSGHSRADEGRPILYPPQTQPPDNPYVPPLLPPPVKPEQVTPSALPEDIIPNPVLDMKILLLYRPGDADGVFAMVKTYLDILGIPYVALDTSQPAPDGTLEEADLWDGVNHGYYYAVMATTSNIWFWLSSTEKAVLETYEQNFAVRHVTWYAFPNAADHGLDFVSVVAANNEPTFCPGTPVGIPFDASLTTAATVTFDYLRPDIALPIDGPCMYGYLAQPAIGADVTPLMQNPDGYTFMAVFRPGNGREHLVMTLGSFYPAIPPAYLHARALPYGIIQWATKGIFLGERHLYFTPQPDDILGWGDTWDAVNHQVIFDNGYRLHPSDLDNLVSWMADFKSTVPNTADFRIEMPFNGEGSEQDINFQGQIITNTLTAKAVEVQNQFTWLNHTYTHRDLDIDEIPYPSYQINYQEIHSNTLTATFLGFSDYTQNTLLTGDYSGINPPNPDLAQAAYDLGVRYMLVNASLPAYNNPSPNTGIPHPYQPAILQVPRYANNIYYFITTPAQEVDYYNIVYCPGYAQNPDTTPPCYDYPTIINTITNQALGFLLDFSVNATMFHMNNLGNYGSGDTVMTDYIESLYGKYNAIYKNGVPILSPRTQEIGQKMLDRMGYNSSGVTGQLNCGDQITLHTVQAAQIPVTGVAYGETVENYAGQNISYFTMGNNSSVVIPGTGAQIPAAISGLTISQNGNDVTLTWPATTQDTQGNPLTVLVYRVYARANAPYFTPTPADLLAEITDTNYVHLGGAAGSDDYTYVVTAVGDNCWQLESAVSNRVAEYDFSLVNGRYNFITLPLADTGLTTAQALATAVSAQTGTTVQQLLTWETSLNAFLTYEPGNPFSQDFATSLGSSYFLLLDGTGNSSFNLLGSVPLSGTPTFNLVGGSCAYNALSLPLSRSDLNLASALASSIQDVTRVLRWVATSEPSGAFETYEPGNPLTTDFATAIGQPYFVCTTASKVWP